MTLLAGWDATPADTGTYIVMITATSGYSVTVQFVLHMFKLCYSVDDFKAPTGVRDVQYTSGGSPAIVNWSPFESKMRTGCPSQIDYRMTVTPVESSLVMPKDLITFQPFLNKITI